MPAYEIPPASPGDVYYGSTIFSAGFRISAIAFTAVELELVYAEITGLVLGLDELFTINGVLLLQPLHVDILDGVLAQGTKLRHLLICIAANQRVSGKVVQLTGDIVAYHIFICLGEGAQENTQTAVQSPLPS